MNRREFLTTSAGLLAGAASAPAMRATAWAQISTTEGKAPKVLKAVKLSIDIKGKSADVFGLVQGTGAKGITLDPGESFNVALTNELSEPTLIHWHGLTPPWPMDGVPDKPAPLIQPGETRTYAFPVADSGTYWMHAHTLQEQNLLAAPLIVHNPKDTSEDEQEVVIMLHDFCFTPAEELPAHLTKGGSKPGMSMGGMGMDGMAEMMAGMSHNDAMKTWRPIAGLCRTAISIRSRPESASKSQCITCR
jgi:FtsP/CotA-like multicopper oxidase with cupredoxin domain